MRSAPDIINDHTMRKYSDVYTCLGKGLESTTLRFVRHTPCKPSPSRNKYSEEETDDNCGVIREMDVIFSADEVSEWNDGLVHMEKYNGSLRLCLQLNHVKSSHQARLTSSKY